LVSTHRGGVGGVLRRERQASEQYFTSSQTLAHLRRQVKGRPQMTQIFVGRSDFFLIRGIG
jgi:hypothetical protein